jgi:hypothetical protein
MHLVENEFKAKSSVIISGDYRQSSNNPIIIAPVEKYTKIKFGYIKDSEG